MHCTVEITSSGHKNKSAFSFSIFLWNTFLRLQFADIGNSWFFVLSRGEFLIIALTINNFPTTCSLNFYIVCPTSILVLIAFDIERFSKTIFSFFSKFKELFLKVAACVFMLGLAYLDCTLCSVQLSHSCTQQNTLTVTNKSTGKTFQAAQLPLRNNFFISTQFL